MKALGAWLQNASRTSTRRFFSSASKAAPTNKTVTISTMASATLVALYCTVYGNPLHASTPADEGLHPPHFPWPQDGMLSSFDHASLRRGYQVYREVCASCHSLSRIHWRDLVGVSHTVDEARTMAEEHQYQDGPNDIGEMFERPGKLADCLPSPYPNEEAARAANAGAYPPDLSLIVKARHGGADYLYSLLMGYPDEPPAGATIAEGQYFNPYFPGTKIAMPKQLFDGLVEYEDGTPGIASQYAKDVTSFLHWAAEPEHDVRKKMGFQAITILSALLVVCIYVKKFRWSVLKTRKIVYNPPKTDI